MQSKQVSLSKYKNPSFTPFAFKTGVLYDYANNKFPSRLCAWHTEGNENPACLIFDDKDADGNAFFGFVYEGVATLQTTGRPDTHLKAGMYFSVAEEFTICGGSGIVMQRLGHKSFFSVGGPIEKSGRLKYIDNCTDSLLISPVKYGDPCLNLLCFPENINQTQHTHPSMRVGMVASGSGECITPWGNIPLYPGQIFIIHEETETITAPHIQTGEPVSALSGLHSFRTFENEGMIVIAYHPDSDFGAQDEEHPMINRTIVDGVSAKYIDEIRTK